MIFDKKNIVSLGLCVLDLCELGSATFVTFLLLSTSIYESF